jgi:tetratricopeptide (TPR) repeat protein
MGRLLSSFDVNQSRTYLFEALEASRERGFRDLEVHALIALAQLATVMGNQQEAQTWISQALAQRESINQDDLALELSTTHFNVAVRSGQVAEAEAILNEALTHFDKPQLVLDIALLKWHQGDFREGARLLEKLIAEQPVLSQIMTLDNNLGMTYWALGESERALTRLRESTRIWQMQGATYQEALSRSNLGLVYTSLGGFSQAQDELAYAETAFKAQGSMTSLADVYQRQATLSYYAGRYQEALHYHEQASELMRNVGDIFRVSYSLATHANCLIQVGQPARAKQMGEEAMALAELTGHPLALVLAYQSAAMTGLPQALPLLEKAQALALQSQMTEQWALCVWLEAKLCKESRRCLDKLYQALSESRHLQLQVVAWLCLQQLVKLGEPLQDARDQAYKLLVRQAPVDWFMVQADGARLERH